MLKLRLARHGTKHRAYYHIVVADVRSPRDGRYIEKVGTYNPKLPRDSEQRVTLNNERITYWLGQGAQTTDRVAKFLGKAGLIAMPAQGQNLEKAKPKHKAVERAAEKAEKEKVAAEAAAAPAEEAPAAEADA